MKIYYQLHKILIKFNFPEEINILSLKALIPGLDISKKHRQKEDIIVSFETSKRFRIKNKKNSYKICGQWSEHFKNELPHLLYNIIRTYMLNHKMFPVHSININGNLFVGHSGVGKTSLAVEALKNNLSVYSFDKSILLFKKSKLQMIAGTQVLSVRKSVRVNFEPSLIAESRNIFDCKVKQSKQVYNIYLFQLSSNNLFIEKIKKESAIHQLYPYFLDIIKSDTIIDTQHVFEGKVTKITKEFLIKKLKKTLSTLSVQFVSGRKEDIVKMIMELNHE